MGAVQILSHSMVQSIEENSVRKGFDPRDFALVAEGGAGPLFAVPIAIEVGHAARRRPAVPRDRGRDGPGRDRHGLRVRGDDLPAALDARRGEPPVTLRGARGAGRRAARRGRDGRRSRRRAADRRGPVPRPGVRAPGRRRLGRDRRRLGREAARGLPRHPRARVLAALRGLGHRGAEHPRPRDRAHAPARDAGGRGGRRVAGRGAPPRGGRVVPRRGVARAGVDALLRPRGAQGRQPALGPRDRQPVRLDHGDPAGGRGARRPLRERS